MDSSITIGTDAAQNAVRIDVQELLATRLLVQGNSGSGKSHLLRRILEESAGLVQQVVIDPEGDFVTLADRYNHVVVNAGDYSEREIAAMGARIREHRASVIVALDTLDIEAQMSCAAAFLNALFDAPREHWFPALVVVDEAQMFAPSASGDVSDNVRRASLSAMTNLMCRGRKRGLAGAIATQRLAKLAKNVAAEASNFLMGRTFLDIDMARAADLLGMERRQAEAIRDLDRGHFLGLGPAISRRPVSIRIGSTQTATRAGTHSLLPLPDAEPQDMRTMLFAELESMPPPPPPPAPKVVPAHDLMQQFAAQDDDLALAEPAAPPELSPEEAEAAEAAAAAAAEDIEAGIVAALHDMLADPDGAFHPEAFLYQDFSVRCRMARLARVPLDLAQFRRRFALAKGGIFDPADARWADLLDAASRLPDDMLAPFVQIGRAAMEGLPCPDDDALGRAYGTRSPGRIRRLVDYMEKHGAVVVRSDFGGRRSIGIPALGLSTEAE
ncbi:ATP-binding protein [Sphingopyxis sp. KK2]|uniref:ATP-binding protein n=1 Tax=Sphingopyxis sp. KK2 TaxID=1855727 RepID=UPI00097E66C8|nr:ATP-binding protein [Sphingopyxis sp. KK2]